MPEEASEKEVVSVLFRDFPELEAALRESGLSLDNQDVQEAVLITAKVFMTDFAERTNHATSKIEDLNPRLDRIIERVKETQAEVKKRMLFSQIALSVTGLAAGTLVLVTNFEGFLAAIKTIITILKNSIASLPFGVAYAATPLGTSEATASILPVIIYGIYILLAIGYVGSFFAMIFAPDKKVRSDAFEYLKQITALFIGVASGKLI